MIKISLPEKINISDKGENRYQVVIEPFYPGYGITVGNALRRVMLSSLEGAAVTSFKLEGAKHEFDSIDFVKEDLVEIMLNLKKLRLKCFSDEPVKLTLEAKGEKEVYANEIKKNADVEIINGDLLIATLTDKKAKFDMEITVAKGIGYEIIEQRDQKNEIGNIAIDSSFSPVLNVGFNIEHVRVGEMTNYEKMTMDIVTDGTIDAESAITKAAAILQHQFSFFAGNTADMPEVASDEPAKEEKKKVKKEAKEGEEKKTKKSK